MNRGNRDRENIFKWSIEAGKVRIKTTYKTPERLGDLGKITYSANLASFFSKRRAQNMKKWIEKTQNG